MTDVLVFLAEGFEEIEAISAIDIFRRAEFDVQVASLTNDITVKGAHQIEVNADITLDIVAEKQFDLIYLPGGGGSAEALRSDPVVQQIIKRHHQAKLKIAAICAAPIALEEAGILKGHHATSFPAMKPQIVTPIYEEKSVVISGHIITSRAAGTTIEFALTLVSELGYPDVANEISLAILHK